MNMTLDTITEKIWHVDSYYITKKVRERPGFENIVFTPIKPALLFPSAVDFISDHPDGNNSTLQSVREAVAFEIEVENEYHGHKLDRGRDSDHLQLTRTSATYFMDSGKYYVAIDDDPSPTDNLLLARAPERYWMHAAGRNSLLSKRDLHIRKTLERAEDSDKIVEIKTDKLRHCITYDTIGERRYNRSLEGEVIFVDPLAYHIDKLSLSTLAKSGTSAFGTHKLSRALFGDLAESYAACLWEKQRHQRGVVQVVIPTELDRLGVKGEMVESRVVCLGTSDTDRLNTVYANMKYDVIGKIRSVHFDSGWTDGVKCYGNVPSSAFHRDASP